MQKLFNVHDEFACFQVKNLLHAISAYLWCNKLIGKEVIMRLWNILLDKLQISFMLGLCDAQNL